jgi:3-hydroxybutyryl-CoA dehydratase
MVFNEGDTYEEHFIVSEEIYQGFLNLFKDQNPLHTSESFAVNKGFKSKVMHGNILNGFLSYFIGECLPDKNVIIHSQEIQYKLPVYLNDKIILLAQITGVYESVNAVNFNFNFKNIQAKTVAKGKIQIGILK